MSPTWARSARAIRAAIFFGALGATACGVDLEREDGRLVVALHEVASGVEEVELTVSLPDRASRTFVLAPAGPSLEHALSAVPVGVVEVSAEAREGGAVVQGARGVVRIDPDSTARLALTLGDDEHPVIQSGALPATIGPLVGAASTLVGEAAIDAAAWADFVRLAQAIGETAEVNLTLTSARVRLLTERSNDVEKLQDLWRGPIALRIARGGAAVEVGTASPGDDAVEADVALSGASTGEVLRLEPMPPTLRLSGEAKREDDDEHVGYVEASITVRAEAD